MPFTKEHLPDDAPREEGQPFYQKTRYTFLDPGSEGAEARDPEVHPLLRSFTFDIRCFAVLPPSDAVGLLNGDDETGLVVWAGALALLERFMRRPHELLHAVEQTDASDACRTAGEPRKVCILELGSGSGVLAVALLKLLPLLTRGEGVACAPSGAPSVCSTHRDSVHGVAEVEIVATDGNESCVELSARNLSEQALAQQGEHLAHLRARAALLPWGELQDARGIVDMTQLHRLLIISADVIYDMDAVPLLVSTVASLHSAFERAQTQRGRSPLPATIWWLLYAPRSLTRASNIAIHRALESALAAHSSWKVARAPLPAQSFTSGFEGARPTSTPSADYYALHGCVFTVEIP